MAELSIELSMLDAFRESLLRRLSSMIRPRSRISCLALLRRSSATSDASSCIEASRRVGERERGAISSPREWIAIAIFCRERSIHSRI